jgi:hypothetical protein
MPISSPDDSVVTIPQTVLERLIARVNAANYTELNADDWLIGLPTPYNDPNGKYNTSVGFRSIEGSQVTGNFTFFYNRDDLSVVLRNVSIAFDKTVDLTLSQLIARINAAAQTHLTALDYEEQPVTVADPLQVSISAASVIVQAQPNSYDYTGSYFLNLIPTMVADDTGVVRTTYVAVGAMNGSQSADKIHAIDDNGVELSTFNFLHNATNVGSVMIRDFFVTHTGNLILDGSFALTVAVNNQPAAAIVASRLVLTPDGGILSYDAMSAFGGSRIAALAQNPNQSVTYVVDGAANIGSALNKLYQYDDQGNLNHSWVAGGLNYIPAVIALTDDGKLYASSSVFMAPVATNNNIPGQQIRIDRLLANGELDSTWAPVVITANGLSAPPSVIDIKPVSGGVWVVFLPSGDASSATPTPIINGFVSVEHTDAASEFAFSPIYFFNSDGSWATGFKNEHRDMAPKAIYDSTNSSVGGDFDILNVAPGKITFFTNRANPINGKLGRQLLTFDLTGKLLPVSGAAYQVQPQWTTNAGIVPLRNGKFLIGGTAKVPYLGGVSAEIVVVARFNTDGTLDKPVYTKTFQAGQPNITVARVRVFETTV